MRLGGSSTSPGDILAGLVLFVRGVTLSLGAFAAGYGILTYAFGDNLWGMNPAYGTAMRVPGAPQSWGTLALTAGVLVLVGVAFNIPRAVLVGIITETVWAAFFLLAFIIEAARNQEPNSAPPIAVWSVVFLVAIHRALLAWSQRKVPGPW